MMKVLRKANSKSEAYNLIHDADIVLTHLGWIDHYVKVAKKEALMVIDNYETKESNPNYKKRNGISVELKESAGGYKAAYLKKG